MDVYLLLLGIVSHTASCATCCRRCVFLVGAEKPENQTCSCGGKVGKLQIPAVFPYCGWLAAAGVFLDALLVPPCLNLMELLGEGEIREKLHLLLLLLLLFQQSSLKRNHRNLPNSEFSFFSSSDGFIPTAGPSGLFSSAEVWLGWSWNLMGRGFLIKAQLRVYVKESLNRSQHHLQA